MIKSLLITASLLVPLIGEAAQPVFRVTKKQGKIFVKEPLELAWHPLRSRIIPLGTLLRVDALSSLEVSLQADAVHVDEVARKIRIAQPLITRLDEDLVRRSEITDYPLAGLWDSGAEASKANKDFPMLSFASAFIRSITTLERTPKVPDIAYKDDPASVEAGATVLPIKILSPTPDALYFLSDGSVSIPVVWEQPANDLTYRLYIWRDDEPRARPVASIPDTWYQIEVDHTGKYKIQVEDETHRYRSQALTITIDRPLPSMLAEDANGESRLADITLSSPYARAIQLVRRPAKPYVQFFSWDDRIGLDKDEFYRLTITKKPEKGAEASKEKAKKIKTTALSAQVALTPGTYTWIVQKMSSEKEKNPKSSDPRTLQIRVGSPALSTIIHEAPGQTLYFDLK